MPDSLQMNTVTNAYIDGSEVYNIYDMQSGFLRRIWPKEDRPTPSRTNIRGYFDITSITSPTVTGSWPATVTFPTPRTVTFTYNGTALPTGYTTITIQSILLRVTSSGLSAYEYWDLPINITSGGSVVNVGDSTTYIKATENTGGETKEVGGVYADTDLVIFGTLS